MFYIVYKAYDKHNDEYHNIKLKLANRKVYEYELKLLESLNAEIVECYEEVD